MISTSLGNHKPVNLHYMRCDVDFEKYLTAEIAEHTEKIKIALLCVLRELSGKLKSFLLTQNLCLSVSIRVPNFKCSMKIVFQLDEQGILVIGKITGLFQMHDLIHCFNRR